MLNNLSTYNTQDKVKHCACKKKSFPTKGTHESVCLLLIHNIKHSLFLASYIHKAHLPAMATATTNITITYCDKCRFMMRAAWIAQELLQTFNEELNEVTLRPSQTAGIFQITFNQQTIWDRKNDGNPLDIKQIKQRVRDSIAPEKNIGHSDTAENQTI